MILLTVLAIAFILCVVFSIFAWRDGSLSIYGKFTLSVLWLLFAIIDAAFAYELILRPWFGDIP